MEQKIIHVMSDAICTDGEYIWIPNYQWNMLVKFNIKKERVEAAYMISGEGAFKQYAYYSDIICHNNHVWMAPGSWNYIQIFNCDKEVFYNKNIEPMKTRESEWKFGKMHQYNGEIYCVPKLYSRMHIYDAETKLLNKTIDYSKFANNELDILSTYGYNNFIYSIIANQNGLFVYDIQCGEVKRILTKAFEEDKKYEIVADEDYVYSFTQCENELRKISLKTGNIISNIKLNDIGFSCLHLLLDKYIVVDDTRSPKYFVLDKELKVIHERVMDKRESGDCLFGGWCDDANNTIYMINNMTEEIHIMSGDDDMLEVAKIPCILDEENIDQINKLQCFDLPLMYREDRSFDLRRYIERLSRN